MRRVGGDQDERAVDEAVGRADGAFLSGRGMTVTRIAGRPVADDAPAHS
jgi:hypothetical protein